MSAVEKAFTVSFVLALSSCSQSTPPEVGRDYRPVGVLPTKDDLFVVAGRTFSGSEYEALGERYPSLSSESRLQLAQYLSLHSALIQTGIIAETVTTESFADDLRVLFLPQPSGVDLEKYRDRLSQIYKVSSPGDWKAKLDAQVKAHSYEWNHAFLKEYGLTR